MFYPANTQPLTLSLQILNSKTPLWHQKSRETDNDSFWRQIAQWPRSNCSNPMVLVFDGKAQVGPTEAPQEI